MEIIDLLNDFSAKLGAQNPDLKNLVSSALKGDVKELEDVQRYVLKSFPDKQKEINDSFKDADFKKKIADLKSTFEDLNNSFI